MPTVDKFWLVANADDNGSSNSLSYNFDVRDHEGFNDNVSFQFEGSSTGYATVTPGYSGKSDERTGTLYRSVMDPEPDDHLHFL